RGPASPAGAIDFEAPRPPLLMVAGALDRAIPPGLNRDNARRYGAAAPTDFRYFEGRIHWICRQKGWREVAGIVEEWLSRLFAR
ncbi:MAG: alpha/beta hydrolase, partial [Proteobacteria bacterium]|nr:alpha/beta hydrolase [Pseudomonadota bacterium]